MNEPWGEQRRYECDDRDRPDPHELVITPPTGNGDWYVAIVSKGSGTAVAQSVRLCTSGGASSAAPGLTSAISDAYRALGGEMSTAQRAEHALIALAHIGMGLEKEPAKYAQQVLAALSAVCPKNPARAKGGSGPHEFGGGDGTYEVCAWCAVERQILWPGQLP